MAGPTITKEEKPSKKLSENKKKQDLPNKPKEEPIKYPDHFYQAKKGTIELDTTPTLEADQPNIVKFGKQLDKEFKQKLKELLQEYQDTFAWSYKDFKGLPAHICEHRIELEPNARPIKQAKYQMNPAYAAKVKEEIDKLLKT
jgi:hypothetical protein